MAQSLAKQILSSKKALYFFHTYQADEKTIEKVIKLNKSMDLDIAIDANGDPSLGHSLEYYEISGETQPKNMDFWQAVNLLAKSTIPVIVDCKDNRALDLTKEVIKKIGAHRCLVHVYAKELKFNYDLYDHDYPSEWLSLKDLSTIKKDFPNVTTTASAKFLPKDLLLNEEYKLLINQIRENLVKHDVDTVCLNVPDSSFTDQIIDFFLEKNILLHIGVDNTDISSFNRVFIGETDNLEKASISTELMLSNDI